MGPAAASNYQHVRDLGCGTFGIAKLMRKLDSGELVAVKFLPRGSLVNDYVEREILNHQSLRHPHIIAFKEAFLTPTHLAIAMEYAIGGELFEYLTRVERFSENEARYFFQQLISGLKHCHTQGICHRDLKLENLLLDGSKAPRLKICDFGYSKHQRFDSGPKSMVGTGAYIAPEVIVSRVAPQQDPLSNVYDGKAADVWSAGVVLYLLLVGRYPFEDPSNPTAFDLTVRRIMTARYEVPATLALSPECMDLLSRMLVVAPQHRITIPSIMRHPFFLRNLPRELLDDQKADMGDVITQQHQQSVAPRAPVQGLRELQAVVQEARVVMSM